MDFFLIQIRYVFLLSFFTAAIAYVYCEILVEPGMLLVNWYKFLEKKVGKYPFLFKPLIECFKCVAGQMALWFYLIIWFITGHYFLFIHLSYISCSIIFIQIINKVYKWSKKEES